MALNRAEGRAINRVIGHLSGDATISRAAVIEDLAILADHAHKSLHASGQGAYTADRARAVLEAGWPVPTDDPLPRQERHAPVRPL